MFKIYCGTTKRLRLLFNEMNAIHPSIKLSMSHTLNKFEDASTQCDCQDRDSILFLDTLYKIASGRLILDLYKKPKDRNMYLLPSSCHPHHHHENTPFSFGMRINRICSLPESKKQRFQELLDISRFSTTGK